MVHKGRIFLADLCTYSCIVGQQRSQFAVGKGVLLERQPHSHSKGAWSNRCQIFLGPLLMAMLFDLERPDSAW